MYHKSRSYDIWLLRYKVQRQSCHVRLFFALLPHYWPQKLKFGKNVKITWRYYPFSHVYYKSRSYDVWFLRYKVQRTGFFCHFKPFLPVKLPNNPKNQNFEIIKKPLEILSVCTTNDDHIMYGSCDIKQDMSFFFLFTPLTTRKTKFLKKWKNSWRYYYF